MITEWTDDIDAYTMLGQTLTQPAQVTVILTARAKITQNYNTLVLEYLPFIHIVMKFIAGNNQSIDDIPLYCCRSL